LNHGTEAADAVIVAALEKPRIYAVDRVEYENYKKDGKPLSIKVTYYCGVSTFNEWIPLLDERPYVKKHAVSWFWKRGMMCPELEHGLFKAEERLLDRTIAFVDDNGDLVSSIPAPDTITVKLDGKYWRVVDCDMGSRRMHISTVVRRDKFLEQAA
jgi:hypothetical protein